VPHLILHLVIVSARHIKQLGRLHGAPGLQGGRRHSAACRAGGGGSTPPTAAGASAGLVSHAHMTRGCAAGRQGVEAKGRMGRCDHAASAPASGGLHPCDRQMWQLHKQIKWSEGV
jgi:hypothetical protein